MEQSQGFPIAAKFMTEFARLSGLAPASDRPRRYLWTDAFAVCNFLGLYQQTNDETWKNLSLLLVDGVHRILGRHRADDARKGWISGLDDREGEFYPTIGGLRIGKQMNERGPDVPIDDRLEWDRDGQYYHYLTKWMHALNRASSVTGNPAYQTVGYRTCKNRLRQIHILFNAKRRDRRSQSEANVLEDEYRSLVSSRRINGTSRPSRWTHYLSRTAGKPGRRFARDSGSKP